MRAHELTKIKKTCFTPKDISNVLGVSARSAEVTASRYSKKGLLIRIKRNIYALPYNWESLDEDVIFTVANIIEVPSYISLTTALAHYDITTQVQRGVYESISLKRTKESIIKARTFLFSKIDRRLYGGFVKKDSYFIATPEKAICDAFYLMSLSRYTLDTAALDIDKIDKKKVRALLEPFPEKTKKLWRAYVGSL